MDTSSLYRTQFVPVILGTDHEGRHLCRTLFRRYGTLSHLLGTRLPFLYRLLPWVVYHSIENYPDMTLLALKDLATEITEADRTPLLYVTAHAAAELPPDTLAALETDYIVLRPSDEPPYCTGGWMI